MATQLEVAKNRLFGEGGLQATNIKLYPGHSRDASAEQMAEQVNKALAQIENGDYDVVEL